MSYVKSVAKRAVRGGVAAAVVAAATAIAGPVAIAPASAAEALPTIPFKIVNHSEKDEKLYVYISGMDGNTWVHVTGKDGETEPYTEQTEPKAYGFSVGTKSRKKLTLPQLQAMRIYFSFGKKLKVTVNAQGIPGVPAGWAQGDPNFRTLFDWTEFTWVQDADGNSTLGGNATQVDMFGFATKITLKGLQGDYSTPVTKRSGFRVDRARRQIFNQLDKAGPPWQRLVINKKGEPLRVLAPYHGMTLDKFPDRQLDGYIDKVWRKYDASGREKEDRITASPQNVDYHGVVINGELKFRRVDDHNVRFSFPKPTTRAAYEGAILPDPIPSDPLVEQQARAIGALLQGAFMRTTLLKDGDLDSCKRGEFYDNNPVNEYAKQIHRPGIKKLAYAFGFDDTCEQSSYIGVHNPNLLKIQILPIE